MEQRLFIKLQRGQLKMDSRVSIYLKRANNEFVLAEMLFKISGDDEKKLVLGVNKEETFYSAVISHCYYSIFYAAKAYLISKNIAIKSKQGEHQQVYFEFKKLVKQGIISEEMLKIYEDIKERAEALLEILKKEKDKRTDFTYETIAQANIPPASESLSNSKTFNKIIKELMSIQ